MQVLEDNQHNSAAALVSPEYFSVVAIVQVLLVNNINNNKGLGVEIQMQWIKIVFIIWYYE